MRFILISDIHFNNNNCASLYNELIEKFLKYIKKHKDINCIFITGDYFDNILSLNSDGSKYAVGFITELLHYTFKHNITVRVIQGTLSHDNTQLENFKPFEIIYPNFKVIDNVNNENLYNCNILYIPEEYVDNHVEYYNEFFNKTYDLIIGHGMIDIASFINEIQESERPIKNAPIFKAEQLLNIANYIFFGHIHTMQIYKNRLFYIGSFSRNNFGEPEKKGFFDVTYNGKNSIKIKRVINDIAPIYNTIKVSTLPKELQQNIPQLVSYVKSELKQNENTKIRIDVDIDISPDNLQLLRESVNNVKNIKIKHSIKPIQQNIEEETKYNFLKEEHADIYYVIQEYIKVTYNKEISKEDIIQLTSAEATEI